MIPIHEYVKARPSDQPDTYFITCRFCKKDLFKVVLSLYDFEELEPRVVRHGLFCEEFKKDV